jgi:nesprin-1
MFFSFSALAVHCSYILNFQTLLGDIQKYQATLDDVKAKGHGQIERYIGTTPSIEETIQKQLCNVQDSYNSLLHTALQIKVRASCSVH